MGYPQSDDTNSYIYNVCYGKECFEISILEPDISTTKLKNNILSFFPSIYFNNLELCIKEDKDTYVLDEDEMISSTDTFIVFIN